MVKKNVRGNRRIRIKPRKCRTCLNVGVWPGGRCYACRAWLRSTK